VVAVALDSKRAEPYVQSFDSSLKPLDAPAAATPAEYAAKLAERPAGFVLAGDAAEDLARALRAQGSSVHVLSELRHPDAAVVASLAATAPLAHSVPAPLYIHPVQTTTPSKAALSVSS
jgi:tRNA threonylcarbamoyladenosine biosynthesis protein TsaB